MPPRIPDETRRDSSCQNLREIASAYMPTLRFARGERFYPVRAESWLTQATAADWPETEGRHGQDLPVDAHRRGTTIVRADPAVSPLRLPAGTPAFEQPVSLEPVDASENAVARYAGVGEDTFMSFGGWADPENRTTGDELYLFRSFSELAGAMEPEVAWQPLDIDAPSAPHLPNMWFPQPVTPTVYAEMRWAGAYSWLAQDRELTDFPRGPNGSRVDRTLAITYHYLYPARHPIDEQSAPTRMEGQWEAVTIFLPAVRREHDRPDDEEQLLNTEPPRFVAISQGLDSSVHGVDIRPWSQVRKLRIATTSSPSSPTPPASCFSSAAGRTFSTLTRKKATTGQTSRRRGQTSRSTWTRTCSGCISSSRSSFSSTPPSGSSPWSPSPVRLSPPSPRGRCWRRSASRCLRCSCSLSCCWHSSS
jgi:hypothetical protein